MGTTAKSGAEVVASPGGASGSTLGTAAGTAGGTPMGVAVGAAVRVAEGAGVMVVSSACGCCVCSLELHGCCASRKTGTHANGLRVHQRRDDLSLRFPAAPVDETCSSCTGGVAAGASMAGAGATDGVLVRGSLGA